MNICGPKIQISCLFLSSLEDILHQEESNHDTRLYLVFEFMQMDLKKYIDTVSGDLDPMLIKVVHHH